MPREVTRMQAIHIRKRLHAPIPELPELTPLVGKTVEIVAREESSTAAAGSGAAAPYDFWNGPSAEELARAQGVKPIKSIDELRSKLPGDPFGPDFEETLRRWREEPWTSCEPDAPGGE